MQPHEEQSPAPPSGSLPTGVTAYVLNEDGSVAPVAGNQASSFISGNNCGEHDCNDMARDTSGNFIIAGGAYLYRYDSAGNALTSIQSGGYYRSVALDAQGDYIVVDTSQNEVIRISHTTLLPTLTIPFDPIPGNPQINASYYDAYVRVDASGNYILLEDAAPSQDTDSPGPVNLYQINPTSQQVTNIPITVTENTVTPVAIGGFTFDANGDYVEVDPYNYTVYTIAKAGSSSAGSASALYVDTAGYLSYPQGIVRDPGSGRFFLVDPEIEALDSFAADGSDFQGITSYDSSFYGGPSSLVLALNTIPRGNTDYVLLDNMNIVGVGANPITLTCDCSGYGSDLAMDAAGNFIVAADSGLFKMTPGAPPTTLSNASEPSYWGSVAVDSSGNYVVADGGGHQVVRIPAAGPFPAEPTFSQSYVPTDQTYQGSEDAFVRIDSQGNYIVVEDNGGVESTGPVHIHKITPTGTVTHLTLSGAVPQAVYGFTIDPTGNYIISDWYNEQVVSVTPAGVGTVLYTNGEGGPLFDIAGLTREAATGNFLITNDYDGPGQLFSMSADGSTLNLVANLGVDPVAVLSVPFSILNTSLPSGAVSQTYAPVTLTAASGTSPLTWSATGLPAGMSVSPASGVLSGVPSSGGTFTAHITVTDSASNVANANLALFISGGSTTTTTPPPPPSLIITTSTIPNGTAGVSYGPFGFSATGGNGVYSWSISGAPAGLNLSSSGILSGTPAASGTFTFTVAVASAGQFAQQNYTLSIALGPLSLQGSNNLGVFAASAAVSAAYTASGGSAPYQFSAAGLPTGLTIDASGHLTGAVLQPGNYTFTVQVTDAEPVTTGVNVSLAVLGINASTLPDASNNIPYQQSLSAVGGSAPYAWTVSGTLPTGLSLSSSGVLTGTPILSGSPAAPQTFTFAVSVTSAGVTASKNLSLTVSLTPQPLSIPGAGANPIALPDGSLQAAYSQALQAAGGIPPYSWSYLAGTLPDGLSLDSSGNVSGMPATASTFAFTAQVRDSAGASASAGFSIRIAPNSLSITNASLPNGIAGTAYPTQAFGAAGGIGPYTFVSNGSLPAGLTFTNGQITGTPTGAGTSSFTVKATDSSGQSASSEFRIAVTPAHPDLILSQNSFSFSFNAGATALPFGPSTAFVSVGSNTPQSVGFTAAAAPAASWLSLSGGSRTPDTIGISLTN
ncbi:MAG TPA: putative Ig domain-containing protein, partial [Bryobacteraceae bacterium]|nr:putative Ig domain-containing protein [Bryobacteraceae bacterium]